MENVIQSHNNEMVELETNRSKDREQNRFQEVNKTEQSRLEEQHSMIKKFEDEIVAFKGDMDLLQEVNEGLQKKNERLHAKNEQLKLGNESIISSEMSARSSTKDIEKKNEGLKCQVKALKKDKKKILQYVNTLEGILKDKSKAIEATKVTLREIMGHVKDQVGVSEDLKQRTKEVAIKEASLVEAQEQAEDLKDTVLNEMLEISSELEKKNSSLVEAQGEIKFLRIHVERLESKVKRKHASQDKDLKEKLRQAENKLEEAKGEIKVLNNWTAVMSTALKGKSEEIGEKESALKEAEGEMNRANTKLLESKVVFDILTSCGDVLESTLLHTHGSIEKIKDNLSLTPAKVQMEHIEQFLSKQPWKDEVDSDKIFSLLQWVGKITAQNGATCMM